MEDDSLIVPILEKKGNDSIISFHEDSQAEGNLGKRIGVESKKLWRIAGPAIFTRLTTYGINLVTQAFAGHLGDLELAAITISTTVLVGLSFGLLVSVPILYFFLVRLVSLNIQCKRFIVCLTILSLKMKLLETKTLKHPVSIFCKPTLHTS